MSLTISTAIGRARDFRMETALAVGFTLTVVTAAYAAGTVIAKPMDVLAPAPIVAMPAVAETPPEPEPVLAMGEPVPGHEINSPFGLRRLPWENHGRLHEGVDIAAPVGQPVLAAADGYVIRSGDSSSYGRYVEIVHAEGLTTLYAHLGRIDPQAKAGAKVEVGQAIGKIGSSGTSTGPHVHFEIRKKDRPLNPVAFIGREFATAEELPLTAAARYSRQVRVAQVSFIPESKRALMPGAKTDGVKVANGKDGRPRASIQFAGKAHGVARAAAAPSADASGSDVSAIIPTQPLIISGAD